MLVFFYGFITVCTYGIALFFLISIVRAFLKTKNVQDALVYAAMLSPFVLRMLRLK